MPLVTSEMPPPIGAAGVARPFPVHAGNRIARISRHKNAGRFHQTRHIAPCRNPVYNEDVVHAAV